MSIYTLKKNRSMLAGNQILQSPQPNNQLSPTEPVEKRPEHSNEPVYHDLPTGHQVTIDIDGSEIEVEDPNGNVAVRIKLEEGSPVVELDGARLQLRSTKAIDVNCEDFNVNAENNVYMNAGGHLTIESTEELHLNCEVDIRLRAKVIWLN